MVASIMEEREEFMVPPKGKVSPDPILKLAHFLKPSSIHDLQPHPPPLLSPNSIKTQSLKVSFNGCQYPQKNWKDWVTHMHSLHQTLWKEVGIHDAILNSTYKVNVNEDLILGFAEKWCCGTNSFVFPWGEVSITLEDMIFLGGYSVLGDSVFSPLENREEIEVFDELENMRSEFTRSRVKKAEHGKWMSYFMKSETRIEHEAFLALWLSRFVFPKASKSISKLVFPTAVRLARGTKVALAPAVLATLYRDLGLMKRKISESRESSASLVVVWSPMQLVQIWVFERFALLQFKPNDNENGEPRFSRWCDKPNVKMNYARVVRELVSEDFCWCPYGMWPCRFYNVKDGWVLMDSGLDEELESFARCVRVSELVEIDCRCIEQYLPHRVAMQFGLGQDLPGPVARANASAEIAWTDYTGPIGDVGLYFPSRFFEPCVTTRYMNWWNHLSGEDDTPKRGSSSSMLPDPKGKKMDNVALVSPVFSPSCPIVEVISSSDEGQEVIAEDVMNKVSSGSIKPSMSLTMQRQSSTVAGIEVFGKGNLVRSEHVSEEGNEVEEDVNLPKTEAEVIAPPSFPQSCKGSDEPSVQHSASSIANERSFEMDNVVKIEVSKTLSGNMSESENEAVDQNTVNLDSEKGESSNLHELEILGSGFDARIRKLEKLFAHLKSAKQGHRLE